MANNLSFRELPEVSKIFSRPSILFKNVLDAILNGDSASVFRERYKKKMIPPFFPKEFNFKFYDFLYVEKGYDTFFGGEKAYRIISVYRDELTDEEYKIITSHPKLVKLPNLDRVQVYTYKEKDLKGDLQLIGDIIEHDVDLYILDRDALMTDYPEHIAKVFTRSGSGSFKNNTEIKPSDLPYLCFVSKDSSYYAGGADDSDCILFMDNGSIHNYDYESKTMIKTKGSFFMNKSRVYSYNPIGKNYIAGEYSTLMLCDVGENVIVGFDSEIRECNVMSNSTIFEKSAFYKATIPPYTKVKMKYPSILTNRYIYTQDSVEFMSTFKA